MYKRIGTKLYERLSSNINPVTHDSDKTPFNITLKTVTYKTFKDVPKC